MPPRTAADALAQSQRARDQGDPVRGESTATLALQLAHAGGETAVAAMAGALLAHHRWRQGHAEAAVQAALAALPAVDALDHAEACIDLRCTLVMAYRELGLVAEALPHAMAAWQRARAEGRPGAMSWALNRLAAVHDSLGHVDRAIEMQQQALALAREDGGVEVRIAAMLNLSAALAARANAYRLVGEHEAERADAEAARAHVRAAAGMATGQPHARMFCQSVAFVAALSMGDLEAMREALEQHQQLAQRHGLEHFFEAGRLMRAQWLLAGGQVDEALTALSLLDRAQLLADHESAPWLLETEHRAYKAAGRAAEALAALEALLALERRVSRQRLDAQARVLQREIEVHVARDEAARLRHQAGALQARADAATRAALVDSLTGLPNRRALDSRLALLLAERGAVAAESGEAAPLAVLLLELERFRSINQQHGRDCGDTVLRTLGALLSRLAPPAAMVARNRAEQFVVLLPGACAAEADSFCEAVAAALPATPWPAPLPPGGPGVALGMACAEPGDDAPTLLRRADAATPRAMRAA